MSNKIKILVVDDNPINRQYFSMALIKAGFEVALAEDGYEAIEKAKKNIFNLILIDIRMPGMDGYEATSRIKSDSQNKDTPIIATSAENINDDKASLFDDFILKPISPKLLKQTIHKYCKHTIIFNKDHALKYSYDDEEIMQKLITMFVTDLPKQMKELDLKISSNDEILSSNLIHKIRGPCKACGADDLDNKLESLSNKIIRTSCVGVSTSFKEVKNAVDTYNEAISKLSKQ